MYSKISCWVNFPSPFSEPAKTRDVSSDIFLHFTASAHSSDPRIYINGPKPAISRGREQANFIVLSMCSFVSIGAPIIKFPIVIKLNFLLSLIASLI